MNIYLSSTLKDTIREVLERTERGNGILDAYGAATRIQQELPEENVALEDIISALLLGRGAIQAVEFIPPKSVLEVVMPASEGRHGPADDGTGTVNVRG